MECNWRIGVALRAKINKENWFITKNKKTKKKKTLIHNIFKRCFQ